MWSDLRRDYRGGCQTATVAPPPRLSHAFFFFTLSLHVKPLPVLCGSHSPDGGRHADSVLSCAAGPQRQQRRRRRGGVGTWAALTGPEWKGGLAWLVHQAAMSTSDWRDLSGIPWRPASSQLRQRRNGSRSPLRMHTRLTGRPAPPFSLPTFSARWRGAGLHPGRLRNILPASRRLLPASRRRHAGRAGARSSSHGCPPAPAATRGSGARRIARDKTCQVAAASQWAFALPPTFAVRSLDWSYRRRNVGRSLRGGSPSTGGAIGAQKTARAAKGGGKTRWSSQEHRAARHGDQRARRPEVVRTPLQGGLVDGRQYVLHRRAGHPTDGGVCGGMPRPSGLTYAVRWEAPHSTRL